MDPDDRSVRSGLIYPAGTDHFRSAAQFDEFFPPQVLPICYQKWEVWSLKSALLKHAFPCPVEGSGPGMPLGGR